MLFAKDLFQMYTNYANFRKWSLEVVDYDQTDIGKRIEKHWMEIIRVMIIIRGSSSRQSIYQWFRCVQKFEI